MPFSCTSTTWCPYVDMFNFGGVSQIGNNLDIPCPCQNGILRYVANIESVACSPDVARPSPSSEFQLTPLSAAISSPGDLPPLKYNTGRPLASHLTTRRDSSTINRFTHSPSPVSDQSFQSKLQFPTPPGFPPPFKSITSDTSCDLMAPTYNAPIAHTQLTDLFPRTSDDIAGDVNPPFELQRVWSANTVHSEDEEQGEFERTKRKVGFVGNAGHTFITDLTKRRMEIIKQFSPAAARLNQLNRPPQSTCVAVVREGFLSYLRDSQGGEHALHPPLRVVIREVKAFSFKICFPEEESICTDLQKLKLPNIAFLVDKNKFKNGLPFRPNEQLTPQSPECEFTLQLVFPYYTFHGEAFNMREFLNIFPEQSSRVFHKLYSSVMALHAHGIAHRDIKEENVMMKGNYDSASAEPILIDLGTATRAKKSDLWCGTTDYMSTWRATHECDEYDPQVEDLYSLYVISKVILKNLITLPHKQYIKYKLMSQERSHPKPFGQRPVQQDRKTPGLLLKQRRTPSTDQSQIPLHVVKKQSLIEHLKNRRNILSPEEFKQEILRGIDEVTKIQNTLLQQIYTRHSDFIQNITPALVSF